MKTGSVQKRVICKSKGFHSTFPVKKRKKYQQWWCDCWTGKGSYLYTFFGSFNINFFKIPQNSAVDFVNYNENSIMAIGETANCSGTLCRRCSSGSIPPKPASRFITFLANCNTKPPVALRRPKWTKTQGQLGHPPPLCPVVRLSRPPAGLFPSRSLVTWHRQYNQINASILATAFG